MSALAGSAPSVDNPTEVAMGAIAAPGEAAASTVDVDGRDNASAPPVPAGGRRREREADRPKVELAMRLLDIEVEISRLEADARGMPLDRAACVERAPRVGRIASDKAAGVEKRLAVMRDVVRRLRRSSVVAVADVSVEMGKRGHPISARSIYRRLDYMAIVRRANEDDFLDVPGDPAWASLIRLSNDKLAKRLRAARRRRRRAREALAAALAKAPRPDVGRLRAAAQAAREEHAGATACRRPPGPAAGSPRTSGR